MFSSAAFKGLALILALVALAFGVRSIFVAIADHDKRVEQSGYDRGAAVYAELARKDEERNRAEDDRRFAAQASATAKAQKQAEISRASGAAANDALASLQRAIAPSSGSESLPSDTTIAGRCSAPGVDPELFGLCATQFTRMGAEAERVRITKDKVIELYQSLTPITDAVKKLGAVP